MSSSRAYTLAKEPQKWPLSIVQKLVGRWPRPLILSKDADLYVTLQFDIRGQWDGKQRALKYCKLIIRTFRTCFPLVAEALPLTSRVELNNKFCCFLYFLFFLSFFICYVFVFLSFWSTSFLFLFLSRFKASASEIAF